MSDKPFSEPDDSDRTFLRPIPGGKSLATPPPASSALFHGGFGSSHPGLAPGASAAVASLPDDAPEVIGMGGSTLVSAAGPLLQLLARLRDTLNTPDAGELREGAVREIRRFEATAQASNIPMEYIFPAHYALCASLDDVVLATPWGSQGAWAQRPLVSTFHPEVSSSDRFFGVLMQVRQNASNFKPVLELMYFCLSLGFMGRYRFSPQGPAEIKLLREEAYAALRQQMPQGDLALSPHWQGVAAPYTPRRLGVPVWVVGVVALGLLGLVYGACLFSLNSKSDAAFQAQATAPLATMPQILRAQPVAAPAAAAPVVPTIPVEPTILDRLSGVLKPEIAAGKVSVLGTTGQPILRLNNQGLFGAGSATVESADVALLQKIGTALAKETGTVVVTGYTDNRPSHWTHFRSNVELSQARAQAVAVILDQTIGDQGRVTAMGLGGANPVADNATAAGRAQNRRIEIVLNHSSGN
ncbi:MAG TPA: type IVB secretion system protein IcmH/DotU [Acidocella sp.]|nr:type IVB secretion system protein IcmH/DotU [Acidocella sp.]